MTKRINLLPYREAERKAANRQFGVMAIAAAGIGLALVLSAHGVTAGYILSQDSRNEIVTAENKKLDEQIEEIKRLKAEIDQMKARKGVIEILQSDRAVTVLVLEQMVRSVPDGIYLKSVKQEGSKLTINGMAVSNEMVATLMSAIEASGVLKKAELVEIKATMIGTRRFSEFNMTAEVARKIAGKDANVKGSDGVKAKNEKTAAVQAPSARSLPIPVAASSLAGKLNAASSAAATMGRPPESSPVFAPAQTPTPTPIPALVNK